METTTTHEVKAAPKKRTPFLSSYWPCWLLAEDGLGILNMYMVFIMKILMMRR